MRWPWISVKTYNKEQDFHVAREVQYLLRIRRLERELAELKACEECHGEGTITVNDSWDKCGPDPQLDRDERCPACHGTGSKEAP